MSDQPDEMDNETTGSSKTEYNDWRLRLTIIRWAFLYGNRQTFALLLSVAIFVLLLVLGTVWEFEMERLVVEARAVQTLFNTLPGGIILFVSVVLSINTAALSQEFTVKSRKSIVECCLLVG